jgi:hypothetical protein
MVNMLPNGLLYIDSMLKHVLNTVMNLLSSIVLFRHLRLLLQFPADRFLQACPVVILTFRSYNL